jgi:hypothetical protein
VHTLLRPLPKNHPPPFSRIHILPHPIDAVACDDKDKAARRADWRVAWMKRSEIRGRLVDIAPGLRCAPSGLRTVLVPGQAGSRIELWRHSGMRHLAQARNPYSLSWLWIPGSRGACHRAALCADPLARPGMTETAAARSSQPRSCSKSPPCSSRRSDFPRLPLCSRYLVDRHLVRDAAQCHVFECWL